MQGANLSYAQLQGANLPGAQLQGAYLQFAQLQGANLPGAQLQGADLNRAQLQGADLNRAQLQGANLSYAQLQGANLSYAQLQGAVLSYAQLKGANLQFAKIFGVDWESTNTQGMYTFNIDNKSTDAAAQQKKSLFTPNTLGTLDKPLYIQTRLGLFCQDKDSHQGMLKQFGFIDSDLSTRAQTLQNYVNKEPKCESYRAMSLDYLKKQIEEQNKRAIATDKPSP